MHAELARELSNVLGRHFEYVDMASAAYVEFLGRAGFPDWLAQVRLLPS